MLKIPKRPTSILIETKKNQPLFVLLNHFEKYSENFFTAKLQEVILKYQSKVVFLFSSKAKSVFLAF